MIYTAAIRNTQIPWPLINMSKRIYLVLLPFLMTLALTPQADQASAQAYRLANRISEVDDPRANAMSRYLPLGVSTAMVFPVSMLSANNLAEATGTPAPFVPLITNTPQADGSIIHIVSSGETLWEIALSYGVKVADILQLNGLSANSNAIYVGQKLIIRLPLTATPTTPVTPSETATRQPSRTPRPPTPTRTQTLSPTPSPAPTSTKAPLLSLPISPDNKTIAYVLIAVGVVGLFVVLIAGFRK
jgi:LysM repeat protein